MNSVRTPILEDLESIREPAADPDNTLNCEEPPKPSRNWSQFCTCHVPGILT